MSAYLGYVAGVLTVSSFLPQVVRSWRTRQTRDLSLGMFTLLTTASALWMTYGIVTMDVPIIVTNALMVALNGAIAVAKVRYS
jgi:MtN3 and saliva related transmembrane protein